MNVNSDRDSTSTDTSDTPTTTRAPEPKTIDWGYGACGQTPKSVDRHLRAEAGILMRAYRDGTVGLSNTTQQHRDEALAEVLEFKARAKTTGNSRDMRAYLKLFREYEDANLRVASDLDKAQRLDQGEATEIHTFGQIQFRGGNVVRNGSLHKMEPSNIPPSHTVVDSGSSSKKE